MIYFWLEKKRLVLIFNERYKLTVLVVRAYQEDLAVLARVLGCVLF